MDDATLAAVVAAHVPCSTHGGAADYCHGCNDVLPCPVATLAAEVDRLRALLTPERLAAALHDRYGPREGHIHGPDCRGMVPPDGVDYVDAAAILAALGAGE